MLLKNVNVDTNEVQTLEGCNFLNGNFSKHKALLFAFRFRHLQQLFCFSCLVHKPARLNMSINVPVTHNSQRTDSNNIEILHLSQHAHYVTFSEPGAAQSAGYPVSVRNAQRRSPTTLDMCGSVWLFLKGFSTVGFA